MLQGEPSRGRKKDENVDDGDGGEEIMMMDLDLGHHHHQQEELQQEGGLRGFANPWLGAIANYKMEKGRKGRKAIAVERIKPNTSNFLSIIENEKLKLQQLEQEKMKEKEEKEKAERALRERRLRELEEEEAEMLRIQIQTEKVKEKEKEKEKDDRRERRMDRKRIADYDECDEGDGEDSDQEGRDRDRRKENNNNGGQVVFIPPARRKQQKKPSLQQLHYFFQNNGETTSGPLEKEDGEGEGEPNTLYDEDNDGSHLQSSVTSAIQSSHRISLKKTKNGNSRKWELLFNAFKWILIFLTFSLFIIPCIIITYQFLSSLHLDLTHKLDAMGNQINMEIAECAKFYLDNSCAKVNEIGIPHMMKVCKEWHICMQRDAAHVERLPILAQLFSNLLNSFIDPLSLKSILVTSLWISFGGVVLILFVQHFTS